MLENREINFLKDVDIIFKGTGLIDSNLKNSYHFWFRILYFYKNDSTIVLDNRQIKINEKQIVVIRPNQIYTIENEHSEVYYYDFQFLDKKSIYDLNNLFNYEYIFNIEDIDYVDFIILQLQKEEQNKKRSFNLLVSGIGLSLLATIFRAMQNDLVLKRNSISANRSDIFLLTEVESKLNENFAFYSNINNLCFGLGISENKLYKLIKHHYSISTKEWISNIKIEKIKVMLIERRNIYDIASKLGFQNKDYMSRFFKNRTGQSINEYLSGFSNK